MAFEGTLQEFTVSMHGNTLEHTFIEVQQGDTASRKIRVHLKTFGGADFLIPYGATAVLSVNKSDGHKILNECEIEDSSTVIITLTSQTIACPGMQLSQIYIFTDDWDIKTQKFYIHAPKAAYDGDAIKSTDEFGVLVETLNRVKQLEEDNERINEAEEERVAAFEERIEKMDQATADANAAAGKANVAADKANAIADQIINDLTKRSNAIVQTVSGESIVATDSSDDPLRGLRVFGKTEQFTTTGAQLLEYPFYNTSKVVNGITFTDNGDGTITASGTATANAYFYLKNSFNAEFDGVLSGCPSGGNASTYYLGIYDGTNYVPDIGSGVTFDGTIVDIFIRISTGTVVNNLLFKPMLNAGDSALPWEPYTGGIQSPNPQYPQELVSAGDDGDVEVGVYGKNLIPFPYTFESQTTGGLTYTTLQDGSIKVTGTKTGTSYFNLIGRLAGDYATEKMCFSRHIYISIENNFMLSARLTDGTYTNGVNDSILNKPIGALYVECKYDNGTTVNEIIHPILSHVDGIGYEPYHKQSLTAITPNGLPGIKVTDATLANYTDSDGNMWCCDEIDFERGVYVKRILQSVIDASTNISLRDLNGFPRFDVYDKTAFLPSAVYDVGMCTHLSCDLSPLALNAKDNSIASWHTGGVFFRIDRFATVEELKAWLVDNPIYFNYILATPIETPLSEEELTAYQALHSNYPVTTVLNDSGAHMEVKYNADTSTYIAQNYVPKSAYTELEARVLALETNAVS